jgi:hypothetical protein
LFNLLSADKNNSAESFRDIRVTIKLESPGNKLGGPMIKKSVDLAFVFLFVFFLSTVVSAETFTAYLTGAQEVPASGSTATGYARVFLNELAGAISFRVVFNNLSSAQTASHIHAPAAIGATTGVAINFGAVGGTSGVITGSAAITPTQIAQLRQNLGYVNVHSTNFPGGEIRGQLSVRRSIDYDGDGRADLSVLRYPSGTPSQYTYFNQNSTTGIQVVGPWGNANTDYPVPGDYDGDGADDIAVYRTGATIGAQNFFWILRSSDAVVQAYAWGIRGDRVVARDYDGDGVTDIAVFRPGAALGSQAYWYIRQSSTNTARILAFGTTGDTGGGTSGDVALPADYDGDGKCDIAVYRFGGLSPSNSFIVLRSSDGVTNFIPWGNYATDYLAPGDYDGDGKTDYAAVRTQRSSITPLVWWILQSSNGGIRVQEFGVGSDIITQGDFDGDGRTDLGVYRQALTLGAQNYSWVQRSFDNSVQVVPWGINGDFPLNTVDTY